MRNVHILHMAAADSIQLNLTCIDSLFYFKRAFNTKMCKRVREKMFINVNNIVYFLHFVNYSSLNSHIFFLHIVVVKYIYILTHSQNNKNNNNIKNAMQGGARLDIQEKKITAKASGLVVCAALFFNINKVTCVCMYVRDNAHTCAWLKKRETERKKKKLQ